jgi:hypothetical protein
MYTLVHAESDFNGQETQELKSIGQGTPGQSWANIKVHSEKSNGRAGCDVFTSSVANYGKLGVKQEFNYADHAEFYNYHNADYAVEAPIKTVDASITAPKKRLKLEKLEACSILPPEIMDPIKLMLALSSRRAVGSTSMLSKRIQLAHQGSDPSNGKAW